MRLDFLKKLLSSILLAALWHGTTTAAAPVAATPTTPAASTTGACWSDAERAPSPGESLTLRGAPAKPFRASPPGFQGLAPLPGLPGEQTGLISGVSPRSGEKAVALTFDLCEGAGERTGFEAGIANFLREHGVKATFFAGGKWLRSHPQRGMQLMADPLFEVGNHSFSHPDLSGATADKLASEIMGTQAEYARLRGDLLKRGCLADPSGVPEFPRVFRFPYGKSSEAALSYLAGQGLAAIQWDVAPGDPSPAATGKLISEEVTRKVKPGSIIVLHANGKGHGTLEALERFVPHLRERGYEFVTVSELLALGKPR